MHLLLDENCASRKLQQLLRAAGHDVETTISALGAGVSDSTIADYACAQRRILISKDTADFARLFAEIDDHPGVLLIFESTISSRLNAASIVRAIHNIASTYAQIDGLILSVNEFQW